MAPRKNAKKKAETPEVNIGAEIFASLRELEKIKGIPVDYMVERLKQALTNAYRKDREDHRDVPAENVVVNISEEGLTMHQIKTVVENLEDLALEIPLDAARRINPSLKVGDTVKQGDALVVLEAMKMQSNYKVNADCIVRNILVSEGEPVNANQVLIELELIKEE